MPDGNAVAAAEGTGVAGVPDAIGEACGGVASGVARWQPANNTRLKASMQSVRIPFFMLPSRKTAVLVFPEENPCMRIIHRIFTNALCKWLF
jgi:hypothetical protein